MAIIYVVEDDTNIQEIEAIALKNSGHKVYTFDDAAHFYKKIKEKVPDLAILDVMLPDEDGYEIVKKIRQNPITKKMPVIMVTAKTSEIDMVRGLDIGADDYIKKPFSIIEFITRVKAVLRRYQPPVIQPAAVSDQQGEYVEYPDLIVNLTNYSVIYKGHSVEMPPKELELLYFLASSPNQVFTREQLLDHIWGYEYIGDTRTVDVHIKRLREKIKDHANWSISTVWGIGYKFEVRS